MNISLIIRKNLWTLACLATMGLAACGTQTGADLSNPDVDATGTPLVAPGESDSSKSRGLNMANARTTSFEFKDRFPQLYALIKSDEALLKDMQSYANQVILASDIQDEASLWEVLSRRESEIIPHLRPYLENLDADQLDQNWESYSTELRQLGLRMNAAEGMFTGLSVAPVLEAQVQALGSAAMQLYLQFEYAYARSLSGEYPYADMAPYKTMVLAGEKLKKIADDRYWPQVSERFKSALIAFTDIHLVKNTAARESTPMPLVGGASTDAYPNMTEIKTAEDFAKEDANSPYGEVMRRILENPSTITDRPENIYVVVIEWANDQDMAQSRVLTHLTEGEDIPHYLKIRRGNGEDQYAISYRFFEDGDKAAAALEKIKPKFPDASLVFCSVKGDQLYQLGI